MVQLSPLECRVLGVLVEKAMTTPGQYPMSINAIVTGCNQKSNRHPVLNVSEDEVFDVLETLKTKGFVRQVMLTGSRVEKFRHVARDVLDIDTNALVILTELLLRGPQTTGELRSRASRMHPLESLDIVERALRFLMDREEPLVRELAPAPGTRARRYAQLLCPDLHPLDAPAAPGAAATPGAPASGAGASSLEARLEALEQEVTELRIALNALAMKISDDVPALPPHERQA